MPRSNIISSISAVSLLTMGMGASLIFGQINKAGIIVRAFFLVVFLMILVLLIFGAVRWRFDIKDGIITYTPVFGRKRTEKCANIRRIYKHSRDNSGTKVYYITIYFIDGKPITEVLYQCHGVQEFLEMIQKKVEEEDNRILSV